MIFSSKLLVNNTVQPDAVLDIPDNLTVEFFNLQDVVDGRYLFYSKPYLRNKNIDINFASLVNGSLMYANDNDIQSFSAKVPSITSAEMMFTNCMGLVSVTSDLSSLEKGNYMFQCNYNLTTGVGYGRLSEFTSGLPSLKSGLKMFQSSKLSAETINRILESLPDYSGTGETHVIGFENTPGGPTCDTSIGTNKGWTVNI